MNIDSYQTEYTPVGEQFKSNLIMHVHDDGRVRFHHQADGQPVLSTTIGQLANAMELLREMDKMDSQGFVCVAKVLQQEQIDKITGRKA